MKRSIIETVLGAVVLVVALLFLSFSYSTANVGAVDGYEISANFTGIGGLGIGDDVQISGVKVGSISRVELADSYLATVYMSIDPAIELPDDTAAFISSESLLGGKFLALEPGASEDYLEEGGVVQYTQAPQNLEQLLGKFIFSMQGSDDSDDE
ncbi:MAG: MlaD family protein [Pseudomonadota bacterium]